MALGLIPIIGVAALVVDGGLLMSENLHAQAVADASALAAANMLYVHYATDDGLDVSQHASGPALAYAAANGYNNDGVSSTVTVNIPPLSGSFVGQAGYAEVIAQANQARAFSSLWFTGTMSVSARAVARGLVPYSKAAILVLDPTNPSVTLSGSTQVTAVNGSVVVDSTSSSAITSSGSPSITTPELDLSGSISYSGHNPNNATITKTGQPNTPDPLAAIPAPSSSGMTVQSTSAVVLSGSTSKTLNPGVYNGGIQLSGSASLTLNPGIYYINGGGISMSGSSSISGSNVFIYNTGDGGINLNGTGKVSLSPMTSGTYTGITIFQDRTNNSAGVMMSGGSNFNCTGTFYFPDSAITLSGSGGVAAMGAQIIAKDLTFSGSSGIKVTYDGSVASKSKFAIVE